MTNDEYREKLNKLTEEIDKNNKLPKQASLYKERTQLLEKFYQELKEESQKVMESLFTNEHIVAETVYVKTENDKEIIYSRAFNIVESESGNYRNEIKKIFTIQKDCENVEEIIKILTHGKYVVDLTYPYPKDEDFSEEIILALTFYIRNNCRMSGAVNLMISFFASELKDSYKGLARILFKSSTRFPELLLIKEIRYP